MKALFLILFSLSICSCGKEDLVAPPITQENTFSCKIDGELFVAQRHGGFLQFEGINVRAMENSWLLVLSNGHHVLYIKLKDLNSPGVRNIERSGNIQNPLEANNSIEYLANGTLPTTHISHENTGNINILQWKNNNLLIFKFDKLILYDVDDPTKTITLTEGKLNINMETLNKD